MKNVGSARRIRRFLPADRLLDFNCCAVMVCRDHLDRVAGRKPLDHLGGGNPGIGQHGPSKGNTRVDFGFQGNG